MNVQWIKPRWVRIWLACLTFYFPFWWLAQFLLFAVTPLLAALLLGYRLKLLEISLGRTLVWSAPPNVAAHPQDFHFIPRENLLIAVVAAMLVGAALVRRLRGLFRVLVGLGVAVLAEAALETILGPRPFGPIHLAGAIEAVIFFGALCLGLMWMLSGWCLTRYWARVASVVAAVALPAAGWLLLRDIFRRGFFGPPRFWDFLALLAIVPAAVLTSWPGPRAPSEPIAPSLKPALWGAATTILLAAGLAWGGPRLSRAFRERQQAANLAALAAYPPNPVDAPYLKIFFQKGVNFSAEFPDPYGSSDAREMLKALKGCGVNAVALIPYGWTRVGSVRIGGFGRHSWESDEGVREMARVAHALGMKVMLKPGMWVRGARYAGDLRFHSAAQRDEWFAAYAKFIDHYARLATQAHADVFCVGGEFVRLSADAAGWRKIIARVRMLYPGPLTYAASFGGEFERIQFWDALDYIGLQDYYPLPADLSTASVVARVEAVQTRFDKPVIFTEAGFPSMAGANRRPWDDSPGAPVALALQARCYEAIFRAFYRQPWFEGMYWWKVGTNGAGGPRDSSLTPWGKPAMAVIKKWYASNSR